jgi:hypothetical protein
MLVEGSVLRIWYAPDSCALCDERYWHDLPMTSSIADPAEQEVS